MMKSEAPLSTSRLKPRTVTRVFTRDWWRGKSDTSMLVILGIALIPLIFTIIKSGYSYIFDNDELNHVQLAYLYLHGARPYVDIYNSVYTPLFGWFLMPIFTALGFSFETISFTRYVMILLFAIRVIASFLIIKKIFGRRISYLFLPMFLVDPFVIFSSMQIRPDNLMMTVYTIGLAFFTYSMFHPKPIKWLVSGILLGGSLLILPKILPSVGILVVGFILYSIIKRKLVWILPMLVGVVAPFVVFALYCLSNGSFNEMFTQAIVEAKAAYSHFPTIVPLGNFYIPGNFLVYGAMGKPLTWFYAWFLPFAAVAGLYATTLEYIKKHTFDTAGFLKITLGITMLAQWGTLFFLQVVFMQHYLPISWLYALFAAVFIDNILTAFSTYRRMYTLSKLTVFVCAIALIITAFTTNIGRSKADSAYIVSRITARWAQIPENTPTFPNFLFRPSIFPITYGYFIGNVPPAILNRLPSIPVRIEQHKLPYLLVDEYLMGKLPVEVQAYITEHYDRVAGDGELMTRKPQSDIVAP